MERLIETRALGSAVEPPVVPAPTRILLVQLGPRSAGEIGEMLRSQWVERLMLSHAPRLSDAAAELLENGTTCVLVEIAQLGSAELSGIEQIRTAAPDVPIVVLTDSADDDSPLRAIRAGAQDYLIKSELRPAPLARSLRHAIERKRFEVQLSHQALHDPLTGLPNRALFLDRLGVALDRSRRRSGSVAVLFLDVDGFKQVNDSLGHAAGDRLLVGLAARMNTMLRPMDTVARFGGDEFTFLFEDLASEREVVLIAERISRIAELPIRLEEGESSIRVSIGIAMVTDPGVSPETVIREADTAMYRAKELGGRRFELFDEDSRRRAVERLELETALRRAVDRSELHVHYQPNISLGVDGGLIGFEALVRWEHPERGLIPPVDFIPLAAQTGLVLTIGEYVLERALGQLARWRCARPDMTISINLSARELEDPGLVTVLAGVIKASGLDPGAIRLEVAESALTHNEAAAMRALRAVKAIGVKVAIDDFGIGSSSLQALRRLPIDMLKIHPSFIAGLGPSSSSEDRAIVAALVKLGHALGASVVAEGVETAEQLAELRAAGCDGASGFLLGRPLPEDQVASLLSV